MRRWMRVMRRVALLPTMIGVCVVPAIVSAQFSPGKLSEGHAFLDNVTQCFKCHEPRKATTPVRCLSCHRDLGQRIDAQAGFHGRMDATKRDTCSDCHAEHAGRSLPLIRWERGRERFDHAATGWALDGAHRKLKCDACHTPDLVLDPGVRQESNLRLERTHLGLSALCRDCHADEHRGQFEDRVRDQDCSACHKTDRWKGVRVDHAAARFALRGRHAQVACQRCHPNVDESNQRVDVAGEGSHVLFKPLDFGSCASCHKDPHRARYGTNCTSCHDESGWASIRVGAFEHDNTNFPLLGKHRGVRCDRCHRAGSFKSAIAHARCADCHRDTHEGQLVHRSDGGECAVCHQVDGFTPARFGLAEHEQTRFPLQDAHRAVACNQCHRALSANSKAGAVQFWFEERACATCHRDTHMAQFADASGVTECTRCHETAGWAVSRFDHTETQFPLRGAHAKVACASCHPVEAMQSVQAVRYRPLDTACRRCHAEPVTETELGARPGNGSGG